MSDECNERFRLPQRMFLDFALSSSQYLKIQDSNYCFNSLVIRLRSQDLKHLITGNGVRKLQGQHLCTYNSALRKLMYHSQLKLLDYQKQHAIWDKTFKLLIFDKYYQVLQIFSNKESFENIFTFGHIQLKLLEKIYQFSHVLIQHRHYIFRKEM